MIRPVYRHRNMGGLYRLDTIWYAARDYQAGELFYPGCGLYHAYTVTDAVPLGSYVCCYSSHRPDATLETPQQWWARPADMFFDGRFERVP